MTASTQKRSTIVALLLAGAFIAILNQTLMITAIPPIKDEMNITANSAQWLTTIFMLVNGIMIPVSAFLIDRFTTRQLFITAMSVFTLGTLVAAIAPNFAMLLAGRVIQSAGGGIMLPLMQTVFLMIFPVNKRGTVMGASWFSYLFCSCYWTNIIWLDNRALFLEDVVLYYSSYCDYRYYHRLFCYEECDRGF